ncbi:wax ester/triacylglycerol synthase family O-acyltransferase [Arsenicicoccus piscis]|uniref:Diacylglycerol O-acyltransferase n=1 Tax=Arsenicicoccus piscis TaxID=673954 RepID=A0ABQ6HJ71_9MICO|nr:wax ester/triacylglycerol synthase family O-acyltransferase [Arsenicicoccus piscis]MCH8628300.1 wax ester/triacylglycerol synthase family O-acyltransferase [Arsenicicoccus piscis]GMA18561.1 diacylglycerol O-acyltransferase [Arsenicicoccus piscis]
MSLVPDRLTALDASFLYVETPATAMHTGSVMVFQPPSGGFDYARLLNLVANRITYVPRYRQKIKEVPGRLSLPVWVPDSSFDVTYHVRRSALPRPGTDEQLQEFVSRVQARPLDRRRPLWEVYLVEGLEHGRFAIVTKTHQALVDGVHADDIAALILDDHPGPRDAPAPTWDAAHEPSDVDLVAQAVLGALTSPTRLVETLRGGAGELQATGSKILGGVGEVVSTLARSATRPTMSGPLNVHTGSARRYVMVGTDLDDHRAVRAGLPGPTGAQDQVSVNDVVLAVLTGALRIWLLNRGEAVTRSTSVRALVPVSVYHRDGAQAGNELMACFVDLPVGEPNAAMRLHQIAFSMRRQMEGGQAMGADALSGLAGFTSPTLHALGSRLGSAVTRRLFNMVVTNVPGPQHELYVADAPMLSTYPVMPVMGGQALSVGLTSYDGGVYYGLNADRDAMPDLDVLGAGIVDALAELVGSL